MIADIIKITLIEYNIISTPTIGTRINVVTNVPKMLPTVDNEYKFPAVCPIVFIDFVLNFIAKGVTAPNKKVGTNKNTILKINGPYISPILNNKIILNKINQIAKKNKVLLNPTFDVVDLTKIKNIQKKLHLNSMKP